MTLFSRTQKQIVSAMVSLALIFSPAREARAFVPLIPLAVDVAAAFVDSNAVIASAQVFSSTAFNSILGGSALALIFGLTGDTNNANGQVRIPLTATTPVSAIPAPFASATASGITTELFGYSICATSSHTSCFGGSSFAAAWLLFQQNISGLSSQPCGTPPSSVVNNVPLTWGNPTGNVCGTNPGTAFITITDAGPGITCPTGYTLSGSVCNLTNARQAVPDKKQDFQRSGATFSPFTGDDKPSANFSAVQATTSTTNDTLKLSTLDVAGHPRLYTVQALSTGGSLVSSQTQMTDANGQTYVQHQIIQVSSTGIVTGSTSTSTAESLNFNPATQQFDSSGSSTPIAPPATQPLTIPTDYARTGEADRAAQKQIDAATADAANVPPDAPSTDQTTLSNANNARNQFTTDIANLPSAPDPVAPPSLGFNFNPFKPVSCSPLGWTFGSPNTAGTHTVTFDVCSMVPTIQLLGNFATYVLTAAYLFSMFTRRPT